MTKYGIVFDSNCGVTKQQVEKDGNFFIPVNINIDGKSYRGGDEILPKDLYEIMKDKSINISTSSSTGEDIKAAFRKGLEKFDELIYIGLSSKFSASQNNARLIAEEYSEFKGKVHVYNSLYSSPWTFLFYDDFIEIIHSTDNKEEIFKKLDYQNDKMFGYLSPGNTYWLYKGGRITRNQYLAANLLKITPIFTIKDGEVDKKNVLKTRTRKGAIEKMYEGCQGLKKMAEELKAHYQYVVIYAGDQKLTDESIELILEREQNLNRKDIIITEISPEQIAHMGPNSFGMSIKIDFKF